MLPTSNSVIASRHTKAIAAAALIVSLAACSSSDSNPSTVMNSGNTDTTDTTTDSEMQTGGNGTGDTGNEQSVNTQTETEARYRITFDANWLPESHPVLYPAGAHFSGLVGSVHNEQVVFWEPGQIATNGIELMAETGAKTLFIDEVNAAIEDGRALSLIDGSGIGSGDGSASIEVTVSTQYPQITVTSMLAPSPDWFVGLHNVPLFDGTDFLDEFTVDALLYDAGTDSGTQYQSANNDTQPRDIIALTTSDASDTSFVQGGPMLGQFIVERLP